MSIHVEKDVVLVPKNGRVEETVEYGTRWHEGWRDGKEYWDRDADLSRRRADRYARDTASDENPEWAELIRRDVVIIYGATEVVCEHDFPEEWDYTYSPAGSKTCRKCGATIYD